MSNQKKSRTLINIIGIPFMISSIYLGDFYFSVLIYLAILIGILEFSRICKGKEIYIQLIPIFIAFILIILNPYNIELLFIISIFIGTYEIFRKKENPISNIGTTIFTIVWVCFFMNYIILIRNIPEQGMLLTFIMFLSVWICDSMAFIFGSKFGEKKILPKISPNKTWLGSIAGFMGVLVFHFILLKFNVLYQENYNFTVFDVLNFSIIFGIIGQLGDFLESMIKRELNVKDSGTILQGHGGILDRMDSLMLAAPCYYIYIKFIIGING